jgi:GTP-binding protein LepA
MEIRNFAIIAHIDHGKSTLADRLLEKTGTVKVGSGEQLLDTMELEKEKGITIKLNPARMFYRANGPEIPSPKPQTPNNNQILIQPTNSEFADSTHQLNLIDTPGHVDFSYEVSRSLEAVEGVLLLVDASQGVQAQTLTNLYLAQRLGLTIIPVVNKIDLAHAQPEETAQQLIDLLQCRYEDICFVSGKTGEGVEELLEKLVKQVPPPALNTDRPLRALVFDSFFDPYLGAVAYVKVVDGGLKKGGRLLMKATGAQFDCLQTGYLQIKRVVADRLDNGEIGYVATGLKSVRDCRVGDTIIAEASSEGLPGYQTPKPMVYASFFPEPGKERELTVALDKLQLNDASLVYEPVNSQALGPGYNVGFLGLLHLEIIQERLSREFDTNVLVTTPTVAYKKELEQWLEPWVDLEIVCPQSYYGAVSDLVVVHRAMFKDVEYIGDRVISKYEAPLSEVITDFYDKLKSATSGYASMDHQLKDYRAADLVAVDLLIAGEKIDALTQLMVRPKAERYARSTVDKLKELIPRQAFEVSIQAAVGAKVLARADISAFRKDVTAKLYGGDVTRKRKLLEKQKKGKKRLRMLGKVEVPSEVFVELLKK